MGCSRVQIHQRDSEHSGWVGKEHRRERERKMETPRCLAMSAHSLDDHTMHEHWFICNQGSRQPHPHVLCSFRSDFEESRNKVNGCLVGAACPSPATPSVRTHKHLPLFPLTHNLSLVASSPRAHTHGQHECTHARESMAAKLKGHRLWQSQNRSELRLKTGFVCLGE